MTKSTHSLGIRSMLAGTLAATAFLAFASPAVPAPSRHDGSWSVLIVTERGSCDRAYRYPVRVSGGRVVYAGTGSFKISGQVRGNGAVSVTVRRGNQHASGTGHLSGNSGGGHWSGGSCSGTWSATRRS